MPYVTTRTLAFSSLRVRPGCPPGRKDPQLVGYCPARDSAPRKSRVLPAFVTVNSREVCCCAAQPGCVRADSLGSPGEPAPVLPSSHDRPWHPRRPPVARSRTARLLHDVRPLVRARPQAHGQGRPRRAPFADTRAVPGLRRAGSASGPCADADVDERERVDCAIAETPARGRGEVRSILLIGYAVLCLRLSPSPARPRQSSAIAPVYDVRGGNQ